MQNYMASEEKRGPLPRTLEPEPQRAKPPEPPTEPGEVKEKKPRGRPKKGAPSAPLKAKPMTSEQLVEGIKLIDESGDNSSEALTLREKLMQEGKDRFPGEPGSPWE